jgi:hypothetical protein
MRRLPNSRTSWTEDASVATVNWFKRDGVPRDSDGLKPPKPVPVGTPEADVFRIRLEHWIGEYFKGRVIVKRRASRVLLATTSITGLIAVLGGVMALLAGSNLPVQIIAVATTALSALSAVLLAWDTHFRHRELWAIRSVTLNRLQELQLEYESTRNESPDYSALRGRLDVILRDALQEWLRVQGRDAGDRRGS